MRFKNKSWNSPETSVVINDPKPEPVQMVIPAEEPKKQEEFFFKCIKCFAKADLMFEGTSYCEPCLKEQLRTG